MVQVQYLNETKTFSPQEISAMVLGKVSIPGKAAIKFASADQLCR
jgi:hypothetical protein